MTFRNGYLNLPCAEYMRLNSQQARAAEVVRTFHLAGDERIDNRLLPLGSEVTYVAYFDVQLRDTMNQLNRTSQASHAERGTKSGMPGGHSIYCCEEVSGLKLA